MEKKLRKIYEGEAYKFYRQSDKVLPVILLGIQKLEADVDSDLATTPR